MASIKDETRILNDRDNFIRENTYSGYHLIGGCHEVVNEKFQIKEMDNLYICDASIFDEFMSSNIHAAIVIIADIFSCRFLQLRC